MGISRDCPWSRDSDGLDAVVFFSTVNILLVSGNREKLPDAVIPLGLLYVAASIPEEHPSRILDLWFLLVRSVGDSHL